MSFDNTIDFKDHIVQFPNRFKQTTVAPGVVELVPTWIENTNEIIEPGTPVDSELFKKLKQNVTIYQQTLAASEGQTIINLARSYLVGQNRISVSVGGVKQYSGQDYTETNPTRLTMNTPLKGGYKVEIIMFTASQALAEDFFEKTIDAIEATQAANDAATQALAAKETVYTVQLTPVANFVAIATTYPTAVNGSEVQTLDDGKIYRKENGLWVYRKALTPGPVANLLSKLELQKYYINVKEFNVVGDGVINDRTNIQTAIDYVASLGGGVLYFPAGDYYVTGTIYLKNGVEIRGYKKEKTRFLIPRNSNFHVIVADTKNDVVVQDISIIGGGKTSFGGSYYGIHYKKCVKSYVSNVYVYDIEAIGVKFTDCDFCEIDRLFVEYSESDYIAAQVGYVMEFDGCYMCTCTRSYGCRVSFGFLIIGDDTPTGGTNGHESQRTIEFATGSVIDNCHIKYHKGHAFDINAATGNRIVNCTSDKYEGSELSRGAFQNKHSSNGSSKNNIFESCVAKNCGSGFYSQQGEKTIFSNCTVENAAYHGFWLNSADYSVISNGIVDGYNYSGVRVEGGSGQNTIDNIMLFALNGTTTEGIKVLGSSNNTFGNISMRNTHAKSISIDATSNNNYLSRGVRPALYQIEDLSTTTIYGMSYQLELSMNVNGQVTIASPQRGMNVGRVRLINTTAVTGTTPKINVGRNGSNGQFISAKDSPLTSGVIANYAPTNGILNTAQFIVASCDGVASAGKTIVSVDGLELQ